MLSGKRHAEIFELQVLKANKTVELLIVRDLTIDLQYRSNIQYVNIQRGGSGRSVAMIDDSQYKRIAYIL